ncbi:MAG TPA: metallophosphoesterase family protein [Thermoanaerobaculia bacterium]|nr:metallophosphoesterase family protein [Thermoanaerobaculia bacterium]
MANRIPEDDAERKRRAEQREKRERLTAHRGKATWGEKLVPLGDFRRASEEAGVRLSDAERTAARDGYLAERTDPTPSEGPFERVAVFGGVYNNHRALAALLEETASGFDGVYCLGDLGGFGPSPEKVWPLLAQGGVATIQGNYEESLASGREDCNCGYTDPRDNHFATLSYDYTAAHCSPDFKAWMGELPKRRRVRLGDRELLLVHGSPRRINEFLFASASPLPFLEALLDQEGADGLLCTHTGLPWHRRLPSGRDVVNVGVLGRPANDGETTVRWAALEAAPNGGPLGVEIRHLAYDHASLAAEMRREQLPEEFVETIETGWWTTCLEILPAKERSASRY